MTEELRKRLIRQADRLDRELEIRRLPFPPSFVGEDERVEFVAVALDGVIDALYAGPMGPEALGSALARLRARSAELRPGDALVELYQVLSKHPNLDVPRARLGNALTTVVLETEGWKLRPVESGPHVVGLHLLAESSVDGSPPSSVPILELWKGMTWSTAIDTLSDALEHASDQYSDDVHREWETVRFRRRLHEQVLREHHVLGYAARYDERPAAARRTTVSDEESIFLLAALAVLEKVDRGSVNPNIQSVFEAIEDNLGQSLGGRWGVKRLKRIAKDLGVHSPGKKGRSENSQERFDLLRKGVEGLSGLAGRR